MGINNQFIGLVFSLFILTILITSCKVIKESHYAKYNQVEWGFRQYFFNDSLQFEVEFKGGHTILNPPLKNFRKYISPAILKYLKKDLKFTLHPYILIYSHPDWKSFGYEYIGFIQDKTPLYNVEAKFSDVKSEFFEVGQMERVGDYLLKKYIVPLNKHDFVIYCYNKILSDTKTDSSRLITTSRSEMMSLRSNEIYNQRKSEKSLIDSAIEISNLPKYGTTLNRIRKLMDETSNNRDKQIISQFLFTAFANLDETDTVKQELYEQHTFKGNKRTTLSEDTVKVNNQLALNKVFESAANNKVLMINESHYDWRHRYFVNLLLDSLYRLGYRYLAMEALENNGKLLNGDYLVTTKTGYYFKEPFMANLTRTALKKGYSLVPYEDVTTEKDVESFNSSVDKREYNQALNLYRHYTKDSTAKWLVLAGYGHINKESFSPRERYSMAKYFFELSGIEPYSINQSSYSDIFSTKVPFDSTSQSPNYFYLRPDQIQDSQLLKQADLYIINNMKETPYKSNHIPYTDFINYLVNNDEIHIQKGHKIWKLYIKQEYFQNKEAIPIYIKRTIGGNFKNSLWLPENNYYLVVTDENDQILFKMDIVKSPEP